MKKIFVQGPITPDFIANSIAKHQHKTDIGAHAIFLGQVRADALEGSTVAAIDYTAYEDMAEKKVHEIRESAFAEWPLSCMHIYHSLGEVKSGEISFFVFVSSPHRLASFAALQHIVDRIKAEAPIWGREMLADGREVWKENK